MMIMKMLIMAEIMAEYEKEESSDKIEETEEGMFSNKAIGGDTACFSLNFIYYLFNWIIKIPNF